MTVKLLCVTTKCCPYKKGLPQIATPEKYHPYKVWSLKRVTSTISDLYKI